MFLHRRHSTMNFTDFALRILLSFMFCFSCRTEAAEGPLRVELDLRRLNNSFALLQNGEQCDLTSACDMRIKGYLDTDNPLAAWPGQKPIESWTKVFEKDNDNTPIVNKIVSRDVCQGDLQRANLRLNVVDVDSFTKNDLVENFECMVPVSADNIAPNVARATWSTERDCDATYNPQRIRLKFRFRVFHITAGECGRPPAGATSKT